MYRITMPHFFVSPFFSILLLCLTLYIPSCVLLLLCLLCVLLSVLLLLLLCSTICCWPLSSPFWMTICALSLDYDAPSSMLLGSYCCIMLYLIVVHPPSYFDIYFGLYLHNYPSYSLFLYFLYSAIEWPTYCLCWILEVLMLLCFTLRICLSPSCPFPFL